MLVRASPGALGSALPMVDHSSIAPRERNGWNEWNQWNGNGVSLISEMAGGFFVNLEESPRPRTGKMSEDDRHCIVLRITFYKSRLCESTGRRSRRVGVLSAARLTFLFIRTIRGT